VKKDLSGVKADLSEVAAAADLKNQVVPATQPVRKPAGFDLDAT
jgi:sec-independent protein translocase protein TatB